MTIKYDFKFDRHDIEWIEYAADSKEFTVAYANLSDLIVYLGVPAEVFANLRLNPTSANHMSESQAYSTISTHISGKYARKKDSKSNPQVSQIPDPIHVQLETTKTAASKSTSSFAVQFTDWIRGELNKLGVSASLNCKGGRNCWINTNASFGGGSFLTQKIGNHKIRVNNDTHLCALFKCLNGTPEIVTSPRGKTKVGLHGQTVTNLQVYID